MLGLELRGEHLLPETGLCVVHGALVGILHLRLVSSHGLDEDDGHWAEELLWLGVLHDAGLWDEVERCTRRVRGQVRREKG